MTEYEKCLHVLMDAARELSIQERDPCVLFLLYPALRELCLLAWAQENATRPRLPLSMRDGRIVYWQQGVGYVDIGIYGTTQVEDWMGDDVVRRCSALLALDYAIEGGAWDSGLLEPAMAWKAWLAAASVNGGTHPVSLRGDPWPGAGTELIDLIDRPGWAPDDPWAAPIRMGADNGRVLWLEYGQGRSRARFLPEDMGPKVVCDLQLWAERDDDAMRSVASRAFAALDVIHPWPDVVMG
jgi:hypothetical protein